MTHKLFYDDPYLTAFEACVLVGGARAELDRTAFYPTGGGQPHDTGTLAGARVVEVVDEGDRVVHVLDRPIPEGPCRGEIDWPRRFDHTQQHHGQHLLSQAFLQTCSAPTISFHLGEVECTIDLDVGGLTADKLAAAEALANRVIREARPVEAKFYEPGQLPPVDLRKLPPDVKRVRIVSVADFDHTPCGGTHPARTSEVQIVKIVGAEHVRKKLRLSFLCGERTLARFDARSRLIDGMCTQLKTAENALADTVARMHEERAGNHRRLKALGLELAAHEGARLRAAAEEAAGVKLARGVFEDREPSWLGAVAEAALVGGKAVAVLGSRCAGAAQLFLSRSADVEFDLRPILTEVLPLMSGKGGGRPHAVQAGGSNPAGVEAAVARAVELVRAQLGA